MRGGEQKRCILIIGMRGGEKTLCTNYRDAGRRHFAPISKFPNQEQITSKFPNQGANLSKPEQTWRASIRAYKQISQPRGIYKQISQPMCGTGTRSQNETFLGPPKYLKKKGRPKPYGFYVNCN